MSYDATFDDADLNGFVDGRIDPGRAAALAESLASDPQARARIDAWKRQNDNLRTMFASVLFEPLPVRLLPGAIRPQGRATPPAREPSQPEAVQPRGRIAGALVTTSLGMALVGFVLGALASLETDGFGLPYRFGPARLQANPGDASALGSLAERAVAAHRTYLAEGAHQVEIGAAEEPKLLRWLQHRFAASARIPDLTRLGWTLVGGRILPGPTGVDAFLVYGSGPERLGLTISHAGAGATTSRGAAPIAVTSWNEGQLSFAVTSDRGSDWLARNGDALRDSIGAQGSPDPAVP